MIIMASRKLDNYLRAYRRRAGLSQDEVAFLLGAEGGTKVSRYERMRRKPSLETAWGYGIIFAADPEHLFAGAIQKVAKQVKRRAEILVRKLETDSNAPGMKLQILRGIASGSGSRPVHEQ